MCRHIYTQHICGHKSVRSEQCSSALMPTATLFCEDYDVAQETSLRPCCFIYCEGDRDVAHWVREGPAALAACDEDISDLKRRLEMCQKEMKILAWYQTQWGPLQREKEVNRAKNLDKLSKELQGTIEETKEKHRAIVVEMSLTKEKLDKSAESTARIMAQFERTTMQILQHPLNNEPQFLPAIPYQDTLVSKPQHHPQLILKKPLVSSSHHPGGFRQLRPALPRQSSALLDSSFTSTNAEDVSPAKNATPKKPTARRGGQRKAKEPKTAQAPPSDVGSTPRRSRKREAELQRLPSSSTRRSNRLETKKQISYAESSESATPDPSPSMMTKPNPISQSSRTTRRRSRKVPDDEDELAFKDASDSDEEEVDDGIDEDWHDPEADESFEPVKKTRSTNKRAATSSTKSRPRKRQAAAAPVTNGARTGPKAQLQSTKNGQNGPGTLSTDAHPTRLTARTPLMDIPATEWRYPATNNMMFPQDYSFSGNQGDLSVPKAGQVNYAPIAPTFIPNPLAGNMAYGAMESSHGGHVPDAMVGAPVLAQLEEFDPMMPFDFDDVPYFDMNMDLANEYGDLGAQRNPGM